MRFAVNISLIFGQLLLCSLCFAQKHKIDSLRKVLPGLKASARIDCLNQLSNEYIEAELPANIFLPILSSISAAFKQYMEANWISPPQ